MQPLIPRRTEAWGLAAIKWAGLACVLWSAAAMGAGGLISGLNVAAPVQHLNINLIFDQSALAGPSAMRTAVQTCATTVQNQIVSNLTVNIDVGWGGTGGSPTTADTLSVSGFGVNRTTGSVNSNFATVKAALIAKAVSPNAIQAVSTLPGSDPWGGATVQLTQSQAYNYGLVSQPGPQTHWIGFATAPAWNYTQSPGPTEYDFVATCIHEITEVLGRVTPFCSTLTYSAMDLYRWTSVGNRSVAGGLAYFSIAGNGASPLHSYRNSNCGAGGDAGDWETSQSPASPFDSNPTIGQVVSLQSFDAIQIDVLGWSSQ